MFTISKEFHFSASHNLLCLADDHPCSRIHGHNYVVTVFMASKELTPTGFVEDYNELKGIGQWIDKHLDHRHLNDVFDCNPTVENMSKILFDLFKQDFPLLKAIEMSETPKTRCRYEP
jgi:6-pyruvoyltetrahydropterin/6-carboxytetrahydropterin synthase